MKKSSDLLTIRSLLLAFWQKLSRRRHFQLFCLLLLMLSSGVAELLSLGMIIPFLAVLSEPKSLWQQPLIKYIAKYIGINDSSQLLFPATLLFVITVIVAAIIRLVNLWLSGRLVAAVGYDLSSEAYMRTLYQPYEVHVKRNSSEVIAATTSQINSTLAALSAVLQIVTASIVAFSLIMGLLIINAPVAIASTIMFGSAYFMLGIATRLELRANGEKIVKASKRQLKTLNEGLGAIRDVLLDGSQSLYLEIYKQADRPQRQLQAKNIFLGTFPRYVLEALGMVTISFVGFLLVSDRGFGVSIIPILGALALGAQRLLPALQQIYSGWALLTGSQIAMVGVLKMLNQPLPPIKSVVAPASFNETLRLVNVSFRYELGDTDVLRHLDLEINRGEKLGLIGETGSGKSTIVDLLLGLLPPTSGQYLVDDKNIHDPLHPERLCSWWAAVAHVPQFVYLADTSISENIAFGIPSHLIDMERVHKAASQAQISDFIESMPNAYETNVGEYGIRLSGGQRQRIGIARALYKQAKVLFLDEATSALDTTTEKSLMSAIEDLDDNLTIIMIAHRLSTVQQCDRVITIQRGFVVAEGSPNSIIPN